MNEQFEKWYCDTYWNFKAIENRQVFFDDGKYNHFDVDLAWNAFKAGRNQGLSDAAACVGNLPGNHCKWIADDIINLAESV